MPIYKNTRLRRRKHSLSEIYKYGSRYGARFNRTGRLPKQARKEIS